MQSWSSNDEVRRERLPTPLGPNSETSIPVQADTFPQIPFAVTAHSQGSVGVFKAMVGSRVIETRAPIVKASAGGICKSSGAPQTVFDRYVEYEHRRQQAAEALRPPTVREMRKQYGEMAKQVRHKAKAQRALHKEKAAALSAMLPPAKASPEPPPQRKQMAKAVEEKQAAQESYPWRVAKQQSHDVNQSSSVAAKSRPRDEYGNVKRASSSSSRSAPY